MFKELKPIIWGKIKTIYATNNKPIINTSCIYLYLFETFYTLNMDKTTYNLYPKKMEYNIKKNS